MSRFRRGIAAALIVVGLAAVVLPSAGASTAGGRHVIGRVSGHTYVLLGPSVFGVTVQQDPLSYSAMRFSDGTVRGEWAYRYWELAC